MLHVLRRVVPWLFLGLVFVAFGLFAWMTTYPDSPALAAAEEWPWVGEPVARFRRWYLPESSEGSSPGDGGSGVEVVRVPEILYEEVERPEGVRSPQVEPLWVEPGMVVRERPEDGARALTRISAYRKVLPLTTQPPWFRVRVESGEERVTGWVRVERVIRPGEPPLGNAPAPVLPVPSRPPEPQKLVRARELLQSDAPGRIGEYTFYSDVTDRSVLDRLDAVAGAVEASYRRRFGVDPIGTPREAVVVFRSESAYRSFQSTEGRLRGLPAGGHAGNGMAVLYAGDQPMETVSAVLVHELTHLLNRRAVGPALPPWLDEGLAEDLGWSEIDPAGRPVFGSWGGTETRQGSTIFRSGGRAVVRKYRLQRALGRLLPLEELLALDWGPFVRRDEGLSYVQSGLFVRYLLESGRRDAFRRFLADTARGEPLSIERLEETLGADLATLGGELDAWVMGLPVG